MALQNISSKAVTLDPSQLEMLSIKALPQQNMHAMSVTFGTFQDDDKSWLKTLAL
jgi:hypothetical protein